VGFDSSLRGRSDFSGYGQSDQAEGHRARKEEFKSGLVEFVIEVGGGGEFGNAPGKVAKRVALAVEELGHPGHEMKQVKVPKKFPWKGRWTEFQQGKDSPRLEDPVDFRKALGAVGKVTQSKGKGDGIHALIREGEVEGIAFDGLFHSTGFCLIEEGPAEIQCDHLGRGEFFLEKQADVTRTAGQIEDFLGRLTGEGGYEFLSPTDIEAEAKEPVEEVVGGCEIAKKSADPRGVIGRVQLAVDLAGALGEVVVKVRFSLSAPTLTRSPALIFPRMTSSAIGSSR